MLIRRPEAAGQRGSAGDAEASKRAQSKSHRHRWAQVGVEIESSSASSASNEKALLATCVQGQVESHLAPFCTLG